MIVYERYPQNGIWHYYYGFLFVYIVLLMGFRYRVGIDTINYMIEYSKFPTLSSIKFKELLDYEYAPLYMLLTAICKSVTPNFVLLQFVHSFLLNLIIFIFLKRNTQNPFRSILLYFIVCGLYFNTEILRESLAIGVFLLNFENLKNERWRRYYLWCFVAIMIHYSAIILLAAPLFIYLKLNWKTIILLLLIGFYYEMIIENILYLIPIKSAGKAVYIQLENMYNEKLNSNWLYLNLIQTVLIPLMVLKLGKKDKSYESMVYAYVFCGICCIYFYLITQRFANYFAVFFVAYLSNWIHYNLKRKLLIYGVMFIFIGFYAFSYANHERFKMWYPYHSVFNPVKDQDREKMHQEEFG